MTYKKDFEKTINLLTFFAEMPMYGAFQDGNSWLNY